MRSHCVPGLRGRRIELPDLAVLVWVGAEKAGRILDDILPRGDFFDYFYFFIAAGRRGKRGYTGQ